MPIKKTPKKSSKRIGDPRHKPKAKPVAKKKAPTKPKFIVPKVGDYFTVERAFDADYGNITTTTVRGIVRKQNQSLMLCNNDLGDYEEDESSLKENLGFFRAFQLDPEEVKGMAKAGKIETPSGYIIRNYKVVTDRRLKEAIDRSRNTSILNYAVSRHDDNSLQFGCGGVVLYRESLQAILKAKKALSKEEVRFFVEAIQEIRENVGSYEIAKVTVQQVEELLAMIPAKKSSKKTKR